MNLVIIAGNGDKAMKWYKQFGPKVGQTKYEHRRIAEQAIGHLLPVGAEVHHVDGNIHNNYHNNLVICQDRAYHFLLHYRTRALRECGNANWLYCELCHKWDASENMRLIPRKNKSWIRAIHILPVPPPRCPINIVYKGEI